VVDSIEKIESGQAVEKEIERLSAQLNYLMGEKEEEIKQIGDMLKAQQKKMQGDL